MGCPPIWGDAQAKRLKGKPHKEEHHLMKRICPGVLVGSRFALFVGGLWICTKEHLPQPDATCAAVAHNSARHRMHGAMQRTMNYDVDPSVPLPGVLHGGQHYELLGRPRSYTAPHILEDLVHTPEQSFAPIK